MMWNPWSQLERLRQEMDNLLGAEMGTTNGEFPLVNVHSGEDAAVLTAEIPGVKVDDIEITAKNNVLTISGQRAKEDLKDGERYLKFERDAGKFVRSFALSFNVEREKISATYKNGILQVYMPRAEADRPKKIAVCAG